MRFWDFVIQARNIFLISNRILPTKTWPYYTMPNGFFAILLFYSIVAGVLFRNQVLNTIYLIFFGISIASAAGSIGIAGMCNARQSQGTVCSVYPNGSTFCHHNQYLSVPRPAWDFPPIVYLLMPAIFIFPILEMKLLFCTRWRKRTTRRRIVSC